MIDPGSPRVGVVVVTFESRRYFPRLKAALEAQDRAYELVVLDNASSPDQCPRADDFPDFARIVQNDTNLGFATANNRGAAMLDVDYIALLNPDAFPTPNWLSTLVCVAESDKRLGSVGSTQIAAEKPNTYDGLGDCYHACGLPWRGGHGHPRTNPPPEGEPFSTCAAGALYRASAWREANGFDESYFCYCEDVDLGFRMRLLGWRMLQATDALIEHVGGGSSGKRSNFAVMYGTRNRTWTFVKNMPGLLFPLLIPAHATMLLLYLLSSPLDPSGPARWEGAWAAVKGLGPILQSRARVQRERKASLADIANAMTWNPFRPLRRAPSLKPHRAPS